jgi:hypothetical protein
LCALTDKGYRVSPLFEPFVTNGMAEQNAHKIAYFRLGGVRQTLSIDKTQLLKPSLYADSSDIPDTYTTPVRSYPPLEKLTIDNPGRMGVTIFI